MNHAELELALELESSREVKITAKLDTGFTDYLAINKQLALYLGLKLERGDDVIIADGHKTQSLVATVNLIVPIKELDAQELVLEDISILVLENEPDILVGYELLKIMQDFGNYRLKINALAGTAHFHKPLGSNLE